MQNTGAGLHIATSEYCDGVNDGACPAAGAQALHALQPARDCEAPVCLCLLLRAVSAHAFVLSVRHTIAIYTVYFAAPAGIAITKWPSEKSKDGGNCACIVTVFGIAYFIS